MNPARTIRFAKKILETEAAAIRAVARRLDSSFHKAVVLLGRCRGKICVTGMGKSGSVAKKLSGTLSSVGVPSFYINPAEALHGDLGALGRGDTILALSHSGKTEELLAFLGAAKSLKLPVVALSGDPHSALAKAARVHLDTSVRREADKLNLAPTASTAAALALGDALALSAASLRGYTAEGFASRHPGGALGERLRGAVGPLARRGSAMAWVKGTDSLATVAAKINAGGVGAALVRGKQGRCAGIIVDGDLRRALARGGAAFLRAKDLMNPRPKSIPAGAQASEALQKMEEKAVYQLVVEGPRKKTVGVIHIHDLLGRGQVRFAPR